MSEDVKRNPDADRILAHSLKTWWVTQLARPMEKFFIANRISPDTLTVVGLTITLLAAAAFAKGAFFIAALLITAGSCFDFLDGRIARITQTETLSGAYFDSVLDRYSDIALFFGILIYYRSSWVLWVVILGLIGSVLISYTKARAETLNVDCRVGLMQRPERLFYLGVGSGLSALITINLMPFQKDPTPFHAHPIFIGVLIWIMLMSHYTAIYRIRHTMQQLKKQQHGGAKSK